MAITLEQARKARSQHRLIPGKGYVRLPEPSMPTEIVAGPEACHPGQVPNRSWHWLKAQQDIEGKKLVRMQWDSEKEEWSPELGSGGRRLGYKVVYLAAHGWQHVGTADAND